MFFTYSSLHVQCSPESKAHTHIRLGVRISTLYLIEMNQNHFIIISDYTFEWPCTVRTMHGVKLSMSVRECGIESQCGIVRIAHRMPRILFAPISHTLTPVSKLYIHYLPHNNCVCMCFVNTSFLLFSNFELLHWNAFGKCRILKLLSCSVLCS